MKKLAIFVLILALLIFTAAMALAHDDYKRFKHFNGTYAMSASGSCIHSENGYSPVTHNARPGVVYAGTTVSNGTWVFKKDKKGTYSYTMYATVIPPVEEPPCIIPVGIRMFTRNDLNFTYEITDFGDITIVTEEGDTLEGNISIDNKIITLFDTLREKAPAGPTTCGWWTIICTATRTLIKIHD